jgi:DNA-binding transcriptional ArsR family regulator
MFKDLDPVLHSQVRLAVISVLMGVKSAEFSFLLECTKTTKGNLSFQLNKLKEAEYIEIHKSFRGNYPLTTCQITDKGRNAFEAYVVSISDYLKVSSDNKDNTGRNEEFL